MWRRQFTGVFSLSKIIAEVELGRPPSSRSSTSSASCIFIVFDLSYIFELLNCLSVERYVDRRTANDLESTSRRGRRRVYRSSAQRQPTVPRLPDSDRVCSLYITNAHNSLTLRQLHQQPASTRSRCSRGSALCKLPCLDHDTRLTSIVLRQLYIQSRSIATKCLRLPDM